MNYPSADDALLRGFRVMVVEDDFLIADDFSRRLLSLGATVIGPAATLDGAHALYESTPDIDAAVLDINLRGTLIFPFAQRLEADGVPFVFCTGYGDDPISECLRHVTRFEKPLSHQGFAAMAALIAGLGRRAV
jgi:CheY-like chemotaxis protein